MKTKIVLLSVALLISTGAIAAPKVQQYVTVDHSTELILDKEAVKGIWAETIPAKVAKAYSPKKWGFATIAEGGFTASKSCVVAARVMLLPLGVNGKTMVYKPEKTISTFDSLPTATKEQCSDLAQTKLKEAIHAMIVALGG
jgi:hypothetical protein